MMEYWWKYGKIFVNNTKEMKILTVTWRWIRI